MHINIHKILIIFNIFMVSVFSVPDGRRKREDSNFNVSITTEQIEETNKRRDQISTNVNQTATPNAEEATTVMFDISTNEDSQNSSSFTLRNDLFTTTSTKEDGDISTVNNSEYATDKEEFSTTNTVEFTTTSMADNTIEELNHTTVIAERNLHDTPTIPINRGNDTNYNITANMVFENVTKTTEDSVSTITTETAETAGTDNVTEINIQTDDLLTTVVTNKQDSLDKIITTTYMTSKNTDLFEIVNTPPLDSVQKEIDRNELDVTLSTDKISSSIFDNKTNDNTGTNYSKFFESTPIMYSKEHTDFIETTTESFFEGENLGLTSTVHAMDVSITEGMYTEKMSNRMEDVQETSTVVYEKDLTSTIQTDSTLKVSNNNDHTSNIIITTLATNNDIESTTTDDNHKILNVVNNQLFHTKYHTTTQGITNTESFNAEYSTLPTTGITNVNDPSFTKQQSISDMSTTSELERTTATEDTRTEINGFSKVPFIGTTIENSEEVTTNESITEKMSTNSIIGTTVTNISEPPQLPPSGTDSIEITESEDEQRFTTSDNLIYTTISKGALSNSELNIFQTESITEEMSTNSIIGTTVTNIADRLLSDLEPTQFPPIGTDSIEITESEDEQRFTTTDNLIYTTISKGALSNSELSIFQTESITEEMSTNSIIGTTVTNISDRLLSDLEPTQLPPSETDSNEITEQGFTTTDNLIYTTISKRTLSNSEPNIFQTENIYQTDLIETSEVTEDVREIKTTSLDRTLYDMEPTKPRETTEKIFNINLEKMNKLLDHAEEIQTTNNPIRTTFSDLEPNIIQSTSHTPYNSDFTHTSLISEEEKETKTTDSPMYTTISARGILKETIDRSYNTELTQRTLISEDEKEIKTTGNPIYTTISARTVLDMEPNQHKKNSNKTSNINLTDINKLSDDVVEIKTTDLTKATFSNLDILQKTTDRFYNTELTQRTLISGDEKEIKTTGNPIYTTISARTVLEMEPNQHKKTTNKTSNINLAGINKLSDDVVEIKTTDPTKATFSDLDILQKTTDRSYNTELTQRTLMSEDEKQITSTGSPIYTTISAKFLTTKNQEVVGKVHNIQTTHIPTYTSISELEPSRPQKTKDRTNNIDLKMRNNFSQDKEKFRNTSDRRIIETHCIFSQYEPEETFEKTPDVKDNPLNFMWPKYHSRRAKKRCLKIKRIVYNE